MSPAAPAPDWMAPALRIVRTFEGCRLTSYPDPGTGGEPWTVGYGSTRINGKAVVPGQIISQQQADSALYTELGLIQSKLAATVPGWSSLNRNRKAAILSFSYNVGANWMGAPGFGTISRAFYAANWSAVPGALLLYVNPGTRVEAGLRRRRLAEGVLWNTPA